MKRPTVTGRVMGTKTHYLTGATKCPYTGQPKLKAVCGSCRNFWGHETGKAVDCKRCLSMVFSEPKLDTRK